MTFYVLVLTWRASANLLPYQLKNPPIVFAGNNLAGALYKYYGLHHWIVGNFIGASLLTISLFVSALILIRYPLNRAASYLFSVSFLVYGILFPAHMTHNTHILALLMVFQFVFLPRKSSSFILLWQGMRYYICWAYASAFIWKIIKGAAFQSDFGLVTFKANFVNYLLLNPDTIRAHVYYFFLDQPLLLNIGAKIVFLMEGSFIIGFFTKKFDLILLLVSILIPVFLFFFADVMFFEGIVASAVFLPERYWQKMAGIYSGYKRHLP